MNVAKSRTRVITMRVACLAEDVEEVKNSLFTPDGQGGGRCWFYDHNCPLADIKVTDRAPTPQEEQEACENLDVELEDKT
jgi:hypothetical protein